MPFAYHDTHHVTTHINQNQRDRKVSTCNTTSHDLINHKPSSTKNYLSSNHPSSISHPPRILPLHPAPILPHLTILSHHTMVYQTPPLRHLAKHNALSTMRPQLSSLPTSADVAKNHMHEQCTCVSETRARSPSTVRASHGSCTRLLTALPAAARQSTLPTTRITNHSAQTQRPPRKPGDTSPFLSPPPWLLKTHGTSKLKPPQEATPHHIYPSTQSHHIRQPPIV